MRTRGVTLLLGGCAVLVAGGLAGCAAQGEPAPEPTAVATMPSTPTATPSPGNTLESSPIVFAFTCGGTSYTTYDAVWEAGAHDCTVTWVTGTEPSAQQRAAVAATKGAATLEQLATTCAETGTGPWVDAVTTADAARVAAGLALYCPGHPQIDHLRQATAAYAG